jgi:hypothetical protein
MNNLKGIVALAVMIAAVYLAWKLFPSYVANYNLRADTDNMAMKYTYAQGVTADGIRDDVIAKARDHDITLTEENVDVDRTQAGVTIDVHYTVPVAIPGRVIDLKFEFTSGNKMLTSK